MEIKTPKLLSFQMMRSFSKSSNGEIVFIVNLTSGVVLRFHEKVFQLEYIQIVTEDDFEFLFMGLVNFQKNQQQEIQLTGKLHHGQTSNPISRKSRNYFPIISNVWMILLICQERLDDYKKRLTAVPQPASRKFDLEPKIFIKVDQPVIFLLRGKKYTYNSYDIKLHENMY